MAPRDITEGRAIRAIAVDIGITSSSATWTNTAEAYDVAIAGQPFILATNDERLYQRGTAPFQKEKFDNSIMAIRTDYQAYLAKNWMATMDENTQNMPQ